MSNKRQRPQDVVKKSNKDYNKQYKKEDNISQSSSQSPNKPQDKQNLQQGGEEKSSKLIDTKSLDQGQDEKEFETYMRSSMRSEQFIQEQNLQESKESFEKHKTQSQQSIRVQHVDSAPQSSFEQNKQPQAQKQLIKLNTITNSDKDNQKQEKQITSPQKSDNFKLQPEQNVEVPIQDPENEALKSGQLKKQQNLPEVKIIQETQELKKQSSISPSKINEIQQQSDVSIISPQANTDVKIPKSDEQKNKDSQLMDIEKISPQKSQENIESRLGKPDQEVTSQGVISSAEKQSKQDEIIETNSTPIIQQSMDFQIIPQINNQTLQSDSIKDPKEEKVQVEEITSQDKIIESKPQSEVILEQITSQQKMNDQQLNSDQKSNQKIDQLGENRSFQDKQINESIGEEQQPESTQKSNVESPIRSSNMIEQQQKNLIDNMSPSKTSEQISQSFYKIDQKIEKPVDENQVDAKSSQQINQSDSIKNIQSQKEDEKTKSSTQINKDSPLLEQSTLIKQQSMDSPQRETTSMENIKSETRQLKKSICENQAKSSQQINQSDSIKNIQSQKEDEKTKSSQINMDSPLLEQSTPIKQQSMDSPQRTNFSIEKIISEPGQTEKQVGENQSEEKFTEKGAKSSQQINQSDSIKNIQSQKEDEKTKSSTQMNKDSPLFEQVIKQKSTESKESKGDEIDINSLEKVNLESPTQRQSTVIEKQLMDSRILPNQQINDQQPRSDTITNQKNKMDQVQKITSKEKIPEEAKSPQKLIEEKPKSFVDQSSKKDEVLKTTPQQQQTENTKSPKKLKSDSPKNGNLSPQKQEQNQSPQKQEQNLSPQKQLQNLSPKRVQLPELKKSEEVKSANNQQINVQKKSELQKTQFENDQILHDDSKSLVIKVEDGQSVNLSQQQYGQQQKTTIKAKSEEPKEVKENRGYNEQGQFIQTQKSPEDEINSQGRLSLNRDQSRDDYNRNSESENFDFTLADEQNPLPIGEEIMNALEQILFFNPNEITQMDASQRSDLLQFLLKFRDCFKPIIEQALSENQDCPNTKKDSLFLRAFVDDLERDQKEQEIVVNMEKESKLILEQKLQTEGQEKTILNISYTQEKKINNLLKEKINTLTEKADQLENVQIKSLDVVIKSQQNEHLQGEKKLFDMIKEQAIDQAKLKDKNQIIQKLEQNLSQLQDELKQVKIVGKQLEEDLLLSQGKKKEDNQTKYNIQMILKRFIQSIKTQERNILETRQNLQEEREQFLNSSKKQQGENDQETQRLKTLSLQYDKKLDEEFNNIQRTDQSINSNIRQYESPPITSYTQPLMYSSMGILVGIAIGLGLNLL